MNKEAYSLQDIRQRHSVYGPTGDQIIIGDIGYYSRLAKLVE